MNQGLLAPNNPKEDGLHTKNPSRFARGFFVFRRLKSLRDGRKTDSSKCRYGPSREKVNPKRPQSFRIYKL